MPPSLSRTSKSHRHPTEAATAAKILVAVAGGEGLRAAPLERL
ncbi:hypothetical protein [Leptolyngbya sp. KIOST-1]|nr:hypothetical protein [Leptolyngbya sp. KIOST-1]